MSSIVHATETTEGPTPAGSAAGSLRQLFGAVLSPGGVATLLIAAAVAALLVAAGQIAASSVHGHLLLAWSALWIGVFLVLALAGHSGLQRLRSVMARWSRARHAAAQDDIMWKLAMTDARILADISRAMTQDAARDVRR